MPRITFEDVVMAIVLFMAIACVYTLYDLEQSESKILQEPIKVICEDLYGPTTITEYIYVPVKK